MFWELRMSSSPSVVPGNEDRDVYLVLDDFGRLGRSWREAGEEGTDRATVFRALLEGQYNAPVRVIAFNIAEGNGRVMCRRRSPKSWRSAAPTTTGTSRPTWRTSSE